MHLARVAALIGVGVLGVTACSLLTDLSSLSGTTGGDAGTGDAAQDAPPNAPFTMTATSPVSLAPGGSVAVTVTLTRAPGFTDAVVITVNGLPSKVVATPLTIPSGSTKGTFNVSADPGAAAGSFALVVLGVAGGASSQAPTTLLVGGVLARFTSGNAFVVPDAVTTLRVKAWGAGGASGAYTASIAGGGGFAQADVSVTPGESLTVDVGGGGQAGASSGGGGGGGYSALLRGATVLVLAGGGGGAGGYVAGYVGMQGGGGGGASGVAGSAGGLDGGGGGGGTPTGGGVGGVGKNVTSGLAGVALVGGAGGDNTKPTTGGGGKGGAPGGGSGGAGGASLSGGGGGGGGWFGGGGGQGGGAAPVYVNAGGGGGGSGWATGANVTLTAGTTPWPGNRNDPDCGDAGAGGVAANSIAAAGAGGTVVLILP